MDYKDLIDTIRTVISSKCSDCYNCEECIEAIAAIETLLAERDAAIKDARDFAHHPCKLCIHWDWERCRCSRPEKDCAGFNLWQWRGPKRGE